MNQSFFMNQELDHQEGVNAKREGQRTFVVKLCEEKRVGKANHREREESWKKLRGGAFGSNREGV